MLDQLGVAHDARIVSAHRTPDRLLAFAKGAADEGFKVIIAGAGGAAHLPGMVASLTHLPVLGVPVQSKALSGQDSLLSIVQMPAGIPVGTLAIGDAGATNAGLLAASILALGDPALASGSRPARGADRWRGANGQQDMTTLPAPGSTIGILGGGQLGRMLAMSAAQLGYRCHIYAPETDSVAAEVCGRITCAEWDDSAALAAFAADCDAITYRIRERPVRPAGGVPLGRRVRPWPRRWKWRRTGCCEKCFIASHGWHPRAFRPGRPRRRSWRSHRRNRHARHPQDLPRWL